MSRKKKYALMSIMLVATLFVLPFALNSLQSNKRNTNDKANDNIIGKLIPGSVVYAEILDDVKSSMDKLISEIKVEMKNNPQMAMQAHPGEFIRNSENYKAILNLGLKAIKPIYDTLYESRNAGLYEYILAMAIEDITGEKFVYNADYGWKNSLEFRMAYEEKVNNTRFNVERILNDKDLKDSDKVEKLKNQGIFAVSDLIKEYKQSDSKISKQSLATAIQDITSKYGDVAISDRTAGGDGVMDNANLFDSLVDLNGEAYHK